MEESIPATMHNLLKVWAMHYAAAIKSPPRYVDRIVFNFQPGMTTRYLAYLLRIANLPSTNDYDKTEISNDLHEAFDEFMTTFGSRKKRILIVDENNVTSPEMKALQNVAEPSILIIQCDDPIRDSHLKRFIQSVQNSKHSLVVFSEPIEGLRKYRIEMDLKVKVVHLVLPWLVSRPK